MCRALFQCPIRRLFVRCHKVSNPRDLYLKWHDRSNIWQAHRQHCSRYACHLSRRCDYFNYQSRGFQTSRNLTTRRLIEYRNRAPVAYMMTSWWQDNISILLALWELSFDEFFLLHMILNKPSRCCIDETPWHFYCCHASYFFKYYFKEACFS